MIDAIVVPSRTAIRVLAAVAIALTAWAAIGVLRADLGAAWLMVVLACGLAAAYVAWQWGRP